MKPARLIILGSAALAGVGAFFMIVGGSKPPAPIKIVAPAPPPPVDEVLVANRDIPFGNMVDRGDLRWQSWPPHAAPAGAILQTRDPNAADEFNGWLARVHVSEGEPIYRDRLVQLGKEGIMATLLPAGMRAVAITIDTGGSSTAGNFIQPGDHVDVIHTFRDDDVARASGGNGMVSETIYAMCVCWLSARPFKNLVGSRSSAVPMRPWSFRLSKSSRSFSHRKSGNFL